MGFGALGGVGIHPQKPGGREKLFNFGFHLLGAGTEIFDAGAPASGAGCRNRGGVPAMMTEQD